MTRAGLFAIALVLVSSCAALPGSAGSSVFHSPQSRLQNLGKVSTVFHGVTAVAVDQQDRVYVADLESIHRFPAGLAGPYNGPEDGEKVMSNNRVVRALAVARDGAIWALDDGGSLSRRAPDGVVSSWKVPERNQSLGNELAVDAGGNAYVTLNRPESGVTGDSDHYIIKVTPTLHITTFAGQPGATGAFADGQGTAARFNSPGALAFDTAGNLYVADQGNLAIRRITPDGTVTTVVGKGLPSLPPSPMPGLPRPDLSPYYEGTVPVVGLTVDTGGQVYFTGTDNRVHRITADGVQSVFAGDGKLCRGIAVCSDVCPSPEIDTCDRDGAAGYARFLWPADIAADSVGRLYLTDQSTVTSGYRLRKIE